LGNNTPLYLSSSAVEIVSTLNVTSTITASNLSGTNTGDETKSSIETKLGAATSSNSGYLTSTDWSTFNNKIAGTGTLNTIPKFTSSSSIGNSSISDNGTIVTINEDVNISGGSLGIGTSSLTGINLHINKTITGATTGYGIALQGAIQSDVTGNARLIWTNPSTQATTFTLGQLVHYYANQATFGAGSTVTTQTGFLAEGTLIGATNNYGFRGLIPSGTNRWNLYMAGTASNYLAGPIGIGTTSIGQSAIAINYGLTGATTSILIAANTGIASDVTGRATIYFTQPSTSAATFTLGVLEHYRAQQGTFGAGSTVTEQRGFYVASNLTGAGINKAFSSDLAASATNWNLHISGTANNYLAGNLAIGTTSIANATLRVARNITGGTTAFGVDVQGNFLSDVTSSGFGFSTFLGTQAATFTLTNLTHYRVGTGTIGAGSTVTNQTGFYVDQFLTGGTNNYAFRSQLGSGTNRWNLYMDGTADNFLAGRLGIGTTVIDSLLHLQSNTVDTRINLNAGSSSYTPYIMFKSVGVNKATIGLGQYNGGSLNNLLLYCDSGDTIFANSSERMRIINTGQLKLNGYTTTTSFSGTAAGYLAFDSSGNIITTATPSTSQWTTSGSNIYYNTGNVGIGTTSPGGLLDINSASTNDRLLLSYSGSTKAAFGVTTGGVAYMYHHTSSTFPIWISAGGNFGIGTTSPASKLNVSGDNITVSAGYGIAWAGDQTRIMTPEDNVSGALIRYGSGGIMRFVNGSTEHMRINGSGNVGIGTTSPVRKFEVNGQSFLGGDIFGGLNSGIFFSGNGNYNAGIFVANSGNDLVLQSGTTERMRITSGGNVGIGLTNPTNRLHVINASAGSEVVRVSDANNADFIIGFPSAGNVGLYAEYGTGGNFIFGTGTGRNERMRITSGGNVGINVSSPSFRLDVDGSLRLSNASLGINLSPNSTGFNCPLIVRTNSGTSSDRVFECYSVSVTALHYVLNNGNWFFAGSNISDRRSKKDIEYIETPVLDKVMQLKPASFRYKDNDKNLKSGFIAQDVKEVLPELVTVPETEDEMMGVDYDGVIAMLTKAIQEQQLQIEELKAKLK
jgi:hypothetical protein